MIKCVSIDGFPEVGRTTGDVNGFDVRQGNHRLFNMVRRSYMALLSIGGYFVFMEPPVR
jgi:hypothetical protein